MTVKIAINGFGRIGRNILRAIGTWDLPRMDFKMSKMISNPSNL